MSAGPVDNANPVMETLDGTEWDIVISGTGLPQSLLALYVFTTTGKAMAQAD